MYREICPFLFDFYCEENVESLMIEVQRNETGF
jgi:hypothetical protein